MQLMTSKLFGHHQLSFTNKKRKEKTKQKRKVNNNNAKLTS